MKPAGPESFLHAFAECVASGDLARIVGLFEESASLVEDDGEILRGHAQIREALAPFLEAEGERRYEIRQLIPIGDDLAVVYNDWRARLPDGAGTDLPLAGAGLQVLRRSADGRWRIVFDEPHGAPDED